MKVSIITVCLNAEDVIENTIKSVLGQDYNNIEYIIIDGKSSDNTLSVINKYKNDIYKIISEKDGGIFDAMNKGYLISTGDIINYMNAGDKFWDNKTVSDVIKHFELQNKIEMCFGDVALTKSNKVIGEMQYGNISKKFLLYNFLCHQTIFAKKRLLSITNGFSNKYKTHSDYDWILNIALKHKIISKYLDNTKICYFDMTGISASCADYNELRDIRRKYFGPIKTYYLDLVRYYQNSFSYLYSLKNKIHNNFKKT